jgi:hypothetical protein
VHASGDLKFALKFVSHLKIEAVIFCKLAELAPRLAAAEEISAEGGPDKVLPGNFI